MARPAYSLNSYIGGANYGTLSGTITSSATTIQVSGTGPGWGNLGQTGPFNLSLNYGFSGEEKVNCPSGIYPWGDPIVTITGITRGYDGTTAVNQQNGYSVVHVFTATDLTEANQLVNEILYYAPTASGQVVTSDGTGVIFTPGGSGGGSPLDITVNSDAVTSSGLFPLQITKQPIIPTDGIIQPLPPLFGFDFPGTFNNFPFGEGSTSLEWICTGFDRNIWMSDYELDNMGVWRVTPQGVATVFLITSGFDVEAICAGPDQNIWMVASTLPGLCQVTPDGVTTLFPVSGFNAFGFICSGPDGNLWVAEGTNDPCGVWQVTTSGVGTFFSFDQFDECIGICSGPDGNIWVTSNIGNIYRVTMEGDFTQFSFSGYNFSGICPGPDGNLWVLDNTLPSVVKITPDGVGTTFTLTSGLAFGPGGIAAGAGGDLWVVNGNSSSTSSSLIKITTAGEATYFPISGTYSLGGICSGPDGALYISNSKNNPDEAPAGLISFPFTVQMSQLNITQIPISNPGIEGVLWNNDSIVQVGSGILPITDPEIPGNFWNNGSIVVISSGILPTTDPVVEGEFWNNNSIMCISSGILPTTAQIDGEFWNNNGIVNVGNGGSGGGLTIDAFPLITVEFSTQGSTAYIYTENAYPLLTAPSGGSLMGQWEQVMTSLPTLVTASQAVVSSPGLYVYEVNTSLDDLILGAGLVVSNMTGTQVLQVFATGDIAQVGPGQSGSVDWSTATPTAIQGTDLTWDSGAQSVSSTLGGIFMATMLSTAGWD